MGFFMGGGSEPKAPGEGVQALTPPDGLPGRCRVGTSPHALPGMVCGAGTSEDQRRGPGRDRAFGPGVE